MRWPKLILTTAIHLLKVSSLVGFSKLLNILNLIILKGDFENKTSECNKI